MLSSFLENKLGFLPVAWVVMGLGCTYSVSPITPREDGFIDRDLVGVWSSANVYLRILITDSGEMKLVDEDNFVYDAYSSRVGDFTYLNLTPEACIECASEDREFWSIPMSASCPYAIFRYSKSGFELTWSAMDTEFAASSMSQGSIAGRCVGECQEESDVCLTAASDELREYVVEHDRDLFKNWGHERWSRVPTGDFTGTALVIPDGDTLALYDVRDLEGSRGDLAYKVYLQLAGIAAPDPGQPYSDESARVLTKLAGDRRVVVEHAGFDAYGFVVGRALVDDADVSAEMVRAGAAWVDHESDPDRALVGLEADARRSARGLWGLADYQESRVSE